MHPLLILVWGLALPWYYLVMLALAGAFSGWKRPFSEEGTVLCMFGLVIPYLLGALVLELYLRPNKHINDDT